VLIRESIIFNTSADIHVRNNLKNFKFKRPAEDKYLQLGNSLIKIKLYSEYVIHAQKDASRLKKISLCIREVAYCPSFFTNVISLLRLEYNSYA
jgi:hypothetical protein